MKNVNSISTIILLAVMTGCGGGNKQTTDDFIIVDVTKSYPKKELILQDFMDVEYIALETTDEFLTQGKVLAIGKEIILVKNQLNDGDIFIYDRNGKGLRKINRKGQGAEEYAYISEIMLDEENNEMFINKFNKILVYDLFGNFKRSLPYEEGTSYSNISNFDKGNIICKDISFDFEGVTGKSPFVILSKQDGSITTEISIFPQQKLERVQKKNHNNFVVVSYRASFWDFSIISNNDSWLLTTFTNDTVFRYTSDHNQTPFMVRTPSIESNNAESYISPVILTDCYYFLQAEKTEPEIKGNTPADAIAFYPKNDLMYDKQEKTISEYTIYNNDYSNKTTVNISQSVVNDEIAFCFKIESYQLVDSYEKGELKDGKLKEIAAKLDAEDNPVIMLVKHKK